jgi:CHAT domain-containing protein/tetratricopeptide (TPR) repeat protein
MAKLPFLTWIGNAFAVLRGKRRSAEGTPPFRSLRDRLDRMSTDAEALTSQGRNREAADILMEALRLGQADPEGAGAELPRAQFLFAVVGLPACGLAQVQGIFQAAIAGTVRALGPDHPELGKRLTTIAVAFHHEGDREFAAKLYREGIRILRLAGEAGARDLTAALHGLAYAEKEQGNLAAAEALFREEIDLLRRPDRVGDEYYSEALDALAELLLATNRAADARPFSQEALAVRGRANPGSVRSLNNLAAVANAAGDQRTAEALAREALALEHATLGVGHPLTLTTLMNLAEAVRAQGRDAEAEPLLREAVELAAKHPDETSPGALVGLLVELLGVHDRLADRAAAETDVQSLLAELRKQFGEEPSVAAWLHSMAERYSKLDIGIAAALCRPLVGLTEATFGKDSPEAVATVANLARLYQAEGRFTDAADVLRPALARPLPPPQDTPDYELALWQVAADVFEALGELPAAEELRYCVLHARIATLDKDHPDLASALYKMGGVLRQLRKYQEAHTPSAEAVRIARTAFGDRDPRLGACLNNLALLYLKVGWLDKAEPIFRELVDLAVATLGEAHPDFATALDNLGVFYHAAGRLEEAVENSGRALALRRRILPPGHPGLAMSLLNVGTFLAQAGRTGEAEAILREAADLLRGSATAGSTELPHVLTELGQLAAAAGRITDARRLLAEAARVYDQALDLLFGATSEGDKFRIVEEANSLLSPLLSLVRQELAECTAAVLEAANLVLRRKGLTTEVGSALRAAILRGRYPHLQDKLRRLADIRDRMASLLLAGDTAAAGSGDDQQFHQLDLEQRRLEANLSQEVVEARPVALLRGVDVQAVAAALPPDAVLVELIAYKDVAVQQFITDPGSTRYLAFVIPGDPGPVRMVDLGPADVIDRLVAGFRAAIYGAAGPNPGRDLTVVGGLSPDDGEPGERLRATVFDVLVPHFAGRCQVILAPDRELTRVPFETLPTEDGRRLIDDYRISYVGVGRDVLRFGSPRGSAPDPACVIGDPDFDLCDPTALSSPRNAPVAGPRFPPLPGARAEAEQVAAALRVQPWLGAEASKSRLLNCRSPKVLHLATHGFFLAPSTSPGEESMNLRAGRLLDRPPVSPMHRGGIALAGANTWLRGGQPPPEAGDGVLTAASVCGLDLSDTALVVLSACETGLGEVVLTGEGVFGLRRAFTQAGARAMVMSLWKVPDDTTGQLMTEFYRQLESGAGPATALRAAQMAIRTKHPDPFSWGAFVCVGDPGW